MSPALGREFAPVVLASTLTSSLALIRSYPVLHAGAVCGTRTAIAIAGASGSGKSTLLAALCAAGAGLLVDDALRVEMRDTELWGYAGANELRLRPRSSSLADQIPNATLQPTIDGRYGLCVPTARVDSVPLDAVLIPDSDPRAMSTEVKRLSPQDALLELLACPRLPGCCDERANSAMFRTVAELSRRLPVARVSTPWGPPFSPELGREIWTQVDALVHGSRETHASRGDEYTRAQGNGGA